MVHTKSNLLSFMAHFILAVCVFDIYLTVRLHDTLIESEENPIAGWFLKTTYIAVSHIKGPTGIIHHITHKSVDVSNLILVKLIGMAGANIIMQWLLDKRDTSLSHYIIIPVFVFQVALLCYLLS